MSVITPKLSHAQYARIKETAQNAAEEVLDAAWDGKLPVDPTYLAQSYGVRVFKAQIPGDVSGMLRKEVGSAPEIYVDVDDPLVRRRFTCAHELGHYVKHVIEDPSDSSEYGYVDLRGPEATQGTNSDEVFANSFGAALLMPGSVVKEMHSQGMNAFTMAQQFAVSVEAMGHRLKGLKLA